MTVEPDTPVAVTAERILDLLDSVEEQLATIRNWAELLIAKKEGGHADE